MTVYSYLMSGLKISYSFPVKADLFMFYQNLIFFAKHSKHAWSINAPQRSEVWNTAKSGVWRGPPRPLSAGVTESRGEAKLYISRLSGMMWLRPSPREEKVLSFETQVPVYWGKDISKNQNLGVATKYCFNFWHLHFIGLPDKWIWGEEGFMLPGRQWCET